MSLDHQPTVAIDLDGTIVEMHPDNHNADLSQLKLREGSREGIEALYEDGWKIIIWTAHKDHDKIDDWLDEHEIPYHEVNHNSDLETGSRKIVADLYIDDRAVSALKPWSDIVHITKKRIKKFSKIHHTILTGYSGVGKTVLSQKMAGCCGLPIWKVDMDQLWRDNQHIADDPHIYRSGSKAAYHYKKLMKTLAKRALSKDEEHILEGTQFLIYPHLLKGHNVILLDADEDTVVKQRLQRDQLNGKIDEQGLERRIWKAKLLYHLLKPAVEEIKTRPNVSVVTPEDREDWFGNWSHNQKQLIERGPKQLTDDTNERMQENIERKAHSSHAHAADKLEQAAIKAPNATKREFLQGRSEGHAHAFWQEMVKPEKRNLKIPEIKSLQPDGQKKVRRTYGSTRSAYRGMFGTTAGVRGVSISHPKSRMFKTDQQVGGEGLFAKRKGVEVDSENERARNVDLIELPEGLDGTSCKSCIFFKDNYCSNSAVQQKVKENFCCNLWENQEMKREWKALSALNETTGGALVQTSLGPRIPKRTQHGGNANQLLPPERRKIVQPPDFDEHLIHENERLSGSAPVDVYESLLTRKKGIAIPYICYKGGLHDAAVTLGHAGGKRGGPARARVLSAADRERIARMGGLAKPKA